jgi:hypothetical protein
VSDLEFRREMAARAAAYSRSLAFRRAEKRDMALLSLASAGMVYLLIALIMTGGSL